MQTSGLRLWEGRAIQGRKQYPEFASSRDSAGKTNPGDKKSRDHLKSRALCRSF
jgi:hypothetical protein